MIINMTELEQLAAELEKNYSESPIGPIDSSGLKREVKYFSRSWWMDFLLGMIIQSII